MNSLNVWGNKEIDAAQKQKELIMNKLGKHLKHEDALLHMQVTPHSVQGTGEMKDDLISF